LPSAKPLRQYARVHLHAFAAETIARVTLLETKQLLPGESGFARLKLDRPIVLFPGDRFILRQYSPVITIGGGRVLDAGDPPIRIDVVIDQRRKTAPILRRPDAQRQPISPLRAAVSGGSGCLSRGVKPMRLFPW